MTLRLFHPSDDERSRRERENPNTLLLWDDGTHLHVFGDAHESVLLLALTRGPYYIDSECSTTEFHTWVDRMHLDQIVVRLAALNHTVAVVPLTTGDDPIPFPQTEDVA